MKLLTSDETSAYGKLGLILTFIGFQFFITGCGQQSLFGGQKNSGQKTSSSSNSSTNDNASGSEQDESSVRVIEYPRDHVGGEDNRIVFEIIKGEDNIAKVECFIDGIQVPCYSGKNTIDLGNLNQGQHHIQIFVIYENGKSDQLREDWFVYDQLGERRHGLHVTREKNKIDILFVIDNSGSMAVEQREIGQRFANFIDRIRGLDWQIGMITTDFRLDVSSSDDRGNRRPSLAYQWGDGRLIPMKRQPRGSEVYYYLTPDIDGVQEIFSENVHRKEVGSGTEQGIRATYRAIQRAVANNSDENRMLNKFFRHKSSLAVVVVSDENESGGGIKNTPIELINLVKKSFGQDKVFQFHSIIAHTQKCIDGQGKSYGYRYEEMSKKTGGIIGDICSDNYSDILSDIGHGVSNLKKIYEMRCTSQGHITNFRIIAKDPSLAIPGYTINGYHVQFDNPLEPGDYELIYHCSQ